jgi:hypothetical protein
VQRNPPNNQIMKTIISSILLTVSVISFGQNIDRDIVSAAGDHYESNNASVSWTLGEVATESYTTTTNTLNQGFHQGNLFISSIEDELDLDVILKAYPNPVMDILIVETQDRGLKYQIINMNGEVLSNGIFTSEKEEVDFTKLPNGVYFLSVSGNKTHKIIKQ